MVKTLLAYIFVEVSGELMFQIEYTFCVSSRAKSVQNNLIPFKFEFA